MRSLAASHAARETIQMPSQAKGRRPATSRAGAVGVNVRAMSPNPSSRTSQSARPTSRSDADAYASMVNAIGSNAALRVHEPAGHTYDPMDPFLIPPPTHEMGVANMTFLLERLYMDCAPGQFVREFTKNALQALEALRRSRDADDEPQEVNPLRRSRKTQTDAEGITEHADSGDEIGEVVWTVYQHSQVPKLAIIDTGIGMTAAELMNNINRLAASGHPQGHGQNFGVGGKISAVPRNKAGVLYFSWKKGEKRGSMVHLWYDDDTNNYGLKQQKVGKGYQPWAPVSDAAKPKEVGEHGTMVVFLGNEDEEDTTISPPSLPTPKRWLYRYLTGRFYRFPAGTKVRANYTRDDKDKRVVTPFETWLLRHVESKGTLDLTGAKAHWFIVKEDLDTSGGHYPTLGVVAALWQDELYDMVSSTTAAGRLHAFGIVFELRRVVIIIEPTAGDDTLTSDTARARLLVRGEPVPWVDWAAEFRTNMPAELELLQAGAAAKADIGNVRQNIIQRLQNLRELFKLPRYRRVRMSALAAAADSVDESVGGMPRRRKRDDAITETVEVETEDASEFDPPTMPATTPKRRRADFYSALVADPAAGGIAVEDADAVEKAPEIKWLSRANGTREEGDLEDRAARFVPERNLLQVNEDFRVFQATITRYADQYPGVPGARSVVLEIAQEWYSQQLVEVVVSARALAESSPLWPYDKVEKLWCEESLTAAVLARYHIDTMVKRTVRSRLGASPTGN